MKIIILGRDGVINHDAGRYIKSPDEWEPLPGSLEAIARLTHAGHHVIVATNQSGLGRGLFDIETLNHIHEKMCRMVAAAGGAIEAVFFCAAVDNADPYRKPNPGMLEDLGRRLKISLRGVPAVGDSWRDIQAALAVGAIPILVRTGKGERTLADMPPLGDNVLVCDDLAAAADLILAQTTPIE